MLRVALCAVALLAFASADANDDAGCDKNHYILGCGGPPIVGIPLAGANGAPTFEITQIFSNEDGTVQYIELTETAGLDFQNQFAGLTLTSTHDGVTKTFTFPNDLPYTATAHTRVVVAATPDNYNGPFISSAIVNVKGFSEMLSLRPDFVVPPRFFPTDGGTIQFTDADLVAYSGLPTDGVQALYRAKGVAPALLEWTACGFPPSCPIPFTMTPQLVGAVEYYDASSDHYFVTASAPDIDALDLGQQKRWQRTGQSFHVGAGPESHLGIEWTYYGVPVCRIYLPPVLGDTHFFSASSEECASILAQYPQAVLETPAAFYAALPDPVTGACGVMPGIVDGDIQLDAVYRLWDGRADTNHRYTTSLDTRDDMISRGWIAEGYGPLGVAMCVW